MSKTPLQVAREALGLTQAELATKAGVGQATISRLENIDPETGRLLQQASAEMASLLAGLVGITELHVLYPERYMEAPRRRTSARA